MTPDLFQHQKAAVALLLQHPRFGLFYDMGTGKTASTLSAIRLLVEQRKISKVLVVCPLAIIDSAWRRDAATFAPELTFASYHDKKSPFGSADLNVINFESFRARFNLLRKMPWSMLVVDESSRMKDRNSQVSRSLRQLAAVTPRVVLLSGTPAPNDALEYWPQINALDPRVLGENYYAFRFRYGKSQRLYVAGGRKVDTWEMNPEMLPAMLDRIATVSHTLRKEDCLELPDKLDEVIEIDLDPAERRAYETMRNDLIVRFDNDEVAVADNVLSEVMKLRQLANGWCYDAEHKAKYVGRTKLVYLIDLLRDIGHQAIIWVEYREDAARLMKLLSHHAVALIGGMTEAARQESIESFQRGRVPYLIAHPQSAGHGLTFVNCHYAVFYGLGYSYELHQQARDRIHRIGQKNKCTYMYLLAKDTIEQDILEVVRGKCAAAEVAREYLQRHTAGVVR